MKHVGRNELCPCGSGKKYKKCHGASTVTSVSAISYNKSLEQLQKELLQFALDHYQPELAKVFERYPQRALLRGNDHAIMQFYMYGVAHWAIFNEKVDGERTIFEVFYNEQHDKVTDEPVRQAFENWTNAIPGVYKVTSVMDDCAFIESMEAAGDTPYKVRLPEKGYVTGSFLIGILLPYVKHYDFIQPLLEVRDENHALLQQIVGMNRAQINENYPHVLAAALKKDDKPIGLAWEDATYKSVSDLFMNQMMEEEADERMIALGIFLWKIFTDKVQPSVEKPNDYAAAIEYVLYQEVLKTMEGKEKELAERYETTQNIISEQASNMIEVLGDEIETSAKRLLD